MRRMMALYGIAAIAIRKVSGNIGFEYCEGCSGHQPWLNIDASLRRPELHIKLSDTGTLQATFLRLSCH